MKRCVMLGAIVTVLAAAGPSWADPVEAPTGPSLGVSVAGGLGAGAPLDLTLAGGPSIPITFGFAPGFNLGRFHVRLGIHFNRHDQQFRVLPAMGNAITNEATVTSLLFAPGLEVALVRGGPTAFYVMVGALAGYESFVTRAEPIMAADDKEVFAGFGVGAFGGFGLRLFPHERVSIDLGGGAQWLLVQMTNRAEDAVNPGTFGTPERMVLNSINVFGTLGATFYFGAPSGGDGATKEKKAKKVKKKDEPAPPEATPVPPPPPSFEDAAPDEDDDIIED